MMEEEATQLLLVEQRLKMACTTNSRVASSPERMLLFLSRSQSGSCRTDC